MESGERTILDRSVALGPIGPLTGATEAVSSRRLARTWILITLVIVLSLGVVAGWISTRGRPDPDRLWVEAESDFLAGRWGPARDSLKALERIRPKSPLDLMLEAQLDTAEGRFDKALATLGHIPDDHSIAGQAYLLAGRIERQRRRLRKAEAAFRRALEVKPGLIDAHKELIYIYGIQSRRREVDAEFHALARLTTLSHHDLFTWALTHFTHWNPDIVEDLDGFIKADPEDRYSRLAVVELLLERPEVESYIETILKPLPDTDPDALALRINLAFNLGRFEEAERLLASAPTNHPRIARIRGEMAIRRRDIDAAIKYFEQAIGAEPYDRVSPMQLAQALRIKGEKTAVEVYLDRVKRLNRVYNFIIRVKSSKKENERTDLAELENAFEEAGLIEEAKGWYTLAITIDPLDAQSQQALHRLGSRQDPRSSSQ